MKLSLARFIVRTMLRQGWRDRRGEGAGARGRAARPQGSGLPDPDAPECRPHALGGGERRAGDVGGTPVAGVVLVGRQGRERGGVGRVVGGPAGAEAAGVEEALVGDDRAAHQAHAAGAQRRSRGRTAAVARAGEVAGGVPAGGEHRVAGALQVDGAAQGAPVAPGGGRGEQAGGEAVARAELDQRAGGGDQLHRRRRDARRAGGEGGDGGPRAGAVEPPHQRGRARVGGGEGGDRGLHVARPGERGGGREEQREDGGQGRRPPRCACGYAVALSSRSASSAGRR